jgi:uncharacterized heparinase superfamily protein
MSRSEDALLLARTVRHLAPAQVAHRVRLRGQRVLIQAAPDLAARVLSRPVPPCAGWPPEFVPVDARTPRLWPSVDLLTADRITLLGHERPLHEWRSTEPPQLWRYHLHYWDWAWSLALDPDRVAAQAVFARLFRTWTEQTRFGHWDEWSPYVVALRAWSWCGQYDALVRGTDLEADFLERLHLHQGYLRAHLEQDVGGNHLLKDIKALVGLAVFFGERAQLRRALARLEREVRRQVLPDGGHFERAPAYHCQVLGDLTDLEALFGTAAPGWLLDATCRMRTWLGLVLLPDGTVPLLNDGFPVHAEMLTALDPGPAAGPGLTVLKSSGLAIARRGTWFLLADVGDPCPDELPAHAHADTLGFLLYEDTAQVVGEIFTSTYCSLARRHHERGTAAHSTLQLDGENSTEVWGTFRAARRARVVALSTADLGDVSTITACHDGYARLAGVPMHYRAWTLTEDGLQVDDVVSGSGKHLVQVRLHVPPERHRQVDGSFGVLEPVQIAAGWEQLEAGTSLLQEEVVQLPWQSQFSISKRGAV